MSLTPSDLHTAIHSVQTAHSRLVLLVGPTGSGKTRLLEDVSAETEYPLVQVGLELSKLLEDVPPQKRPNRIWRIMGDILTDQESETVLLDNIELLFLPDLQQDPLRLLRDLARNRTLVVAWPGQLERNNELVYAEPGHPEYRLYRRPETICLRMPGTL